MMAEGIHREITAADMCDLLQYFEAKSQALDKEGHQTYDMSTLQFISLIKFNGTPILPPLLTKQRREEMLSYKQEALRREHHSIAKTKDVLRAKVQSIVAGVEEKRAIKQSVSSANIYKPPSRARKSTEKRAGNEVITKVSSKVTTHPGVNASSVITKVSSKVTTHPGVNAPSELLFNIQNVGRPGNADIKLSMASEKYRAKFFEATRHKSHSSLHGAADYKLSEETKQRPSYSTSHGIADFKSSDETKHIRSRSSSQVIADSKSSDGTKHKSSHSALHGTAESKKPTNYKSLVRVGNLSKQKSLSSQHLDRPNLHIAEKYDISDAINSNKNLSLSPKSSALLPNSPEGRPPSKGFSLRQSVSTPDLRNNDISVRKEDLKKPLLRSRSPKGGRLQAEEKKETDSPIIQKVEEKSKNISGKSVNQQASQLKENIKVKLVTKEDALSKEQISKTEMVNKKHVENVSSRKTNVAQQKLKVTPKQQPSQNPLEVLEQEIMHAEEIENNKKLAKQNLQHATPCNVNQNVEPIQTATADLFPLLTFEQQALATFDSLQSEFTSLEQCDSLPHDYNGMPLTSLKEQQIMYMLSKLSKALNMEDTGTLTSTINSMSSGDSKAEKQQEVFRGQSLKLQDKSENSSNPNGADDRDGHFEQVDIENAGNDSSANVTIEGSNSLPSSSFLQNTSASSSHSRARMSPTGSSILSSASSVSGSRPRMSPKSLKNTVHFSSLVTEISTAASQSFEDKISYRKLDITPKSSETFDEDTEVNESNNMDSSGYKSGLNLSPPAGSNMLSKVSLSHNIDSSWESPGELSTHNLSEHISQDGELNTSDKENEFVHERSDNPYEDHSSDTNMRTGRNPQILNVYIANIPPGPIGENHPAVVKSSIKSDNSEHGFFGRSQDKLLQENHSNNITNVSHMVYNSGSTDLERYMHEKIISYNSITSLQEEEITRSYPKSQHKLVQNVYEVNGNEKSKKKEILSTIPNLDVASMFLKPIVSTNSSLKLNQSLLEDEDQIRNNLQNLQIDVLCNNEMKHEIEIEERECVTIIDKTKLNSEIEEKIIKEQIVEMGHNVQSFDSDIDNFTVQEDCDKEEIMEKLITDQPVEIEHVPGIDCSIENVTVQEDYDTDNSEELTAQNFPDSFNNNQKVKLYNSYENPVVKELKNNHDTKKMAVRNELMDGYTKNNQKQPLKFIEQEIYDPEILKETYRIGQNEEEAKAEHILRYLSQVHEQSLRNEDEFNSKDSETKCHNMMEDIGELIKSFTSSIQSMNHLSEEDLFRLQTEQFNLIQQQLIEHQRAQLEELFVAQRREQMCLQQEIEAAHVSPPFPVQPAPSAAPFFHYPSWNVGSYSNSYTSVPYPDSRVTMAINFPCGVVEGCNRNIPFKTFQDAYVSNISSHDISYCTIPNVEPLMQQGNSAQHLSSINCEDAGSSQSSNAFIYPSSPSLYMNPKHQNNASDVSGFVKATPQQLIFSNQSTPVPQKIYKPIEHSPVKKVVTKTPSNAKLTFTNEIYEPEMQHKYDRISAVVKGYLTRRLLRTPKVQEIIQILNDTRNFAFSFQGEALIKKGNYSREDMGLLARIVAQLQAALLDIHEIFFIIPIAQRMAIISAARQQEQERWIRESSRQSVDSVTSTHPKLSKATLKALDRKRKAQIAEEAVFGSVEFRSKSAPPGAISPQTSADISGPLRRHYHSLFAKALRPLQGHVSQIRPDSHVSVRESKECRPMSAQDKKTESFYKNKKHSGTKTSRSASSIESTKSKTANVKMTKKADKTWR